MDLRAWRRPGEQQPAVTVFIYSTGVNSRMFILGVRAAKLELAALRASRPVADPRAVLACLPLWPCRSEHSSSERR